MLLTSMRDVQLINRTIQESSWGTKNTFNIDLG